MSSVNKSGTRFTPKLTRRRRINAHATRVATSVSTPEASESVNERERSRVKETSESGNNKAKTNEESTLLTLAGKETASEQPLETAAPNLPAKAFLEPAGRRASVTSRDSRRPSSVNHGRPGESIVPFAAGPNSRRLSSLSTINSSKVSRGIDSRRSSTNVLPPLFADRRASVSSSLGGNDEYVAEIQEKLNDGAQPVRITIPSAAPSRRRRSSLARIPRRRRLSRAVANASTKVVMAIQENSAEVKKDPSNTEETNTEVVVKKQKELELTPAELKAKAKYFLDPIKDRLVKVELGVAEDVPAAEDESLVIDNVQQLRGLKRSDNHELLEKFVINEKKMSLKELCKPFVPIGKVSRDYSRAVEGDKLRKKRSKERSEKRKLAKKLRLPLNELEGEEESRRAKESQQKVKEMLDQDVDDENGGHRMVPLLVAGEDGTVTYSHESTYVDRHSTTTADTDKERIVENPYENLVTSGTYSKQKYVDKWTPQETAEFYKALSMWGTDFGLIAHLFPYRDRKQVKAKFNLEERRHPHLIEFALVRKLSVNIDEYSGKSGKEFKTLTEYNAELKDLKLKHDKELRKMATAKEQARVEDLNNAKREADVTTTKVTAKSRKAVILEFRRNEEVVGTINKE
ncbi:DEKNAAC101368 [Brettanomyces naardenensis]|uniref:DEKNAAC101368 n=1 Tax=Brettanomyces naardenensis TaxID=13370 RepID=A0A448YHN2_BRENA|nr:DEKNAAC101368 [Brettanomyces naardenensis]